MATTGPEVCGVTGKARQKSAEQLAAIPEHEERLSLATGRSIGGGFDRSSVHLDRNTGTIGAQNDPSLPRMRGLLRHPPPDPGGPRRKHLRSGMYHDSKLGRFGLGIRHWADQQKQRGEQNRDERGSCVHTHHPLYHRVRFDYV